MLGQTRNSIGHAVRQMSACVAESDSRKRRCIHHLLPRFGIIRVVNRPQKVCSDDA